MNDFIIRDLVRPSGLHLLTGHRTAEVGRHIRGLLAAAGYEPLLLTLRGDGSPAEFALAVAMAKGGGLILVASPLDFYAAHTLFRHADVLISCARDGFVTCAKGGNARAVSQNYRGLVVPHRAVAEAEEVSHVTPDAEAQRFMHITGAAR